MVGKNFKNNLAVFSSYELHFLLRKINLSLRWFCFHCFFFFVWSALIPFLLRALKDTDNKLLAIFLWIFIVTPIFLSVHSKSFGNQHLSAGDSAIQELFMSFTLQTMRLSCEAGISFYHRISLYSHCNRHWFFFSSAAAASTVLLIPIIMAFCYRKILIS